MADLIAAIPALLGFHPKDSLVLVSTHSRGQPGVDFTLRLDLPPPALLARAVAELTRLLRAQRCDELLLVVVGGAESPVQPSPPDVPDHAGPPLTETVVEVIRAAAATGARVWAAVWAAELLAGATWRCYGSCGCHGLLPDPASSPLAAAAVAAGRVIYASREEVERLVAPTDPAALRRRARLLDRHVDEVLESGRAPSGAEALAVVRHWVDASATGQPRMTDDDVARLCLALSDPLVRDAAFGFALDPATSVAAERLWASLVTEAPDPEAAEPAVLLAYSALIRGDGVLAGIALARARQACPGHALGGMFQAALDAGCGADQLRDWVLTGCQRAVVELNRDGEPR